MQTDTDTTEIEINRIKYVRKDTIKSAPEIDPEKYVIVRCETAGVFFGRLCDYNASAGIAVLSNCRRLWSWVGAASISQLAVDGTSKPELCKFPTAVPHITVAKVIEVVPCTIKAVASLSGVAIWKM